VILKYIINVVSRTHTGGSRVTSRLYTVNVRLIVSRLPSVWILRPRKKFYCATTNV